MGLYFFDVKFGRHFVYKTYDYRFIDYYVLYMPWGSICGGGSIRRNMVALSAS